MADEALVIRGINWQETLPFTNIFSAFRVAIHPSKLVLALMAIVALFLGGWVLDELWPASHRAVVISPPPVFSQPLDRLSALAAAPVDFSLVAFPTTEIEMFSGNRRGDFAARRSQMRDSVVRDYAILLQDLKIEPNRDKAMAAARDGADYDKIKDKLLADRNVLVDTAEKTRKQAVDAAEEIRKQAVDAARNKPAAERYQAEKEADAACADAVTAATAVCGDAIHKAYADASQKHHAAHLIKGQGIFRQFLDFEILQFCNAVEGVCNLSPAQVVHSGRSFIVSGPLWLFLNHCAYGILIGIWYLIVGAIFGGAIARIAAVHVARDEKLSIRQAVRFSAGKFLSFVFAPVIPVVIIAVVGLIVALAALVGNIPAIGPVIVGLLFFLALGAGFIMTLVLFGTAGGFNLMYPTIAVEGSDSFDAISRSFSYVYARPWRMLFYTMVASVYGAITYLFVHCFVFIIFWMTHFFVNEGMFARAGNTAPLWDALWHRGHGLTYGVDWFSLTFMQRVGAGLVLFWVYVVIALVGAFVISFYFSANTVIYYLMRREVDATEMDDVYLEQSEDEFTSSAPADESAATALAPAVPAAPASAAPTATPDAPPAPDNPPLAPAP